VTSTRTLPTARPSTARYASAMSSRARRTSRRPCSSPTGSTFSARGLPRVDAGRDGATGPQHIQVQSEVRAERHFVDDVDAVRGDRADLGGRVVLAAVAHEVGSGVVGRPCLVRAAGRGDHDRVGSICGKYRLAVERPGPQTARAVLGDGCRYAGASEKCLPVGGTGARLPAGRVDTGHGNPHTYGFRGPSSEPGGEGCSGEAGCVGVPGMSSMFGARCRSRARPTWEAVTTRDSAMACTTDSSVAVGRPGKAPPSGRNGTQAMPSAAHSRSMSSSSGGRDETGVGYAPRSRTSRSPTR